jgi:hypothetical protein
MVLKYGLLPVKKHTICIVRNQVLPDRLVGEGLCAMIY